MIIGKCHAELRKLGSAVKIKFQMQQPVRSHRVVQSFLILRHPLRQRNRLCPFPIGAVTELHGAAVLCGDLLNSRDTGVPQLHGAGQLLGMRRSLDGSRHGRCRAGTPGQQTVFPVGGKVGQRFKAVLQKHRSRQLRLTHRSQSPARCGIDTAVLANEEQCGAAAAFQIVIGPSYAIIGAGSVNVLTAAGVNGESLGCTVDIKIVACGVSWTIDVIDEDGAIIQKEQFPNTLIVIGCVGVIAAAIKSDFVELFVPSGADLCVHPIQSTHIGCQPIRVNTNRIHTIDIDATIAV